jgi:nucleotide-binding universal stress UspA family protein
MRHPLSAGIAAQGSPGVVFRGEEGAAMYKKIVVGIDGSATARTAMEHAAELARTSGADLHIVSAYNDGSFAAASAAADPSGVLLASSMANIQKDMRALAEELLSRASAEIKGVQVETHPVAGDPAGAICDVAETIGADLIVVGNKGMSGAKRFLLGSVPNRIAHHAPCSVLIVATT